MPSLTEESWEKLFSRYDILNKVVSEGDFVIKSKQIKEFREPRLMTKFDHEDDLPDIFYNNHLSILPLSRSEFRISNDVIFSKIPSVNQPIQHIQKPLNIFSYDVDNINTEAIALKAAFNSGIIEDFIKDGRLLDATSGRMSSGSFDFFIKNKISSKYDPISVHNSQIEIDGTFEGEKTLSIFEAKMAINSTFLVRQLYYPFRKMMTQVGDRKLINLVYFVYTNNIFTLIKFKVKDNMYYNSLIPVLIKNYSFEDSKITRTDIEDILERTEVVKEPEIPFPQANSFQRVISLAEAVSKSSMNGGQIADNYSFDIRQSAYYGDACQYLGLIQKNEKDSSMYEASDLGIRIMNLSYRERQLELVKLIVSHNVFREVLIYYLKHDEMMPQNELVNAMKRNSLFNIGKESTFKRRSSTITSWVYWIICLFLESK